MAPESIRPDARGSCWNCRWSVRIARCYTCGRRLYLERQHASCFLHRGGLVSSTASSDRPKDRRGPRARSSRSPTRSACRSRNSADSSTSAASHRPECADNRRCTHAQLIPAALRRECSPAAPVLSRMLDRVLAAQTSRSATFARPGPGAEPRFPHTAGTSGEGRDRVDARFQPGLIGSRGMARIDGAC